MSTDLRNTVALVTGANRGIGRAIVQRLLESGARVYAGARNPVALQPLLEQYGPRLRALKLDVTSDADVAAAAEAAGDVNLLINNAGVAGFSTGLDAHALDAARHEIEVNYLGLLRVTGAFAPILHRNGGGTVVNIASIASMINFPVLGTYSASKAAAWSVSLALRAGLAPQGTRVITVHPGPIDTDMAEAVPFDKVPPAVVADALVAALASGDDEIFPDPMAQDLHARWSADRHAVQREMSASPQPA